MGMERTMDAEMLAQTVRTVALQAHDLLQGAPRRPDPVALRSLAGRIVELREQAGQRSHHELAAWLDRLESGLRHAGAHAA